MLLQTPGNRSISELARGREDVQTAFNEIGPASEACAVCDSRDRVGIDVKFDVF